VEDKMIESVLQDYKEIELAVAAENEKQLAGFPPAGFYVLV